MLPNIRLFNLIVSDRWINLRGIQKGEAKEETKNKMKVAALSSSSHFDLDQLDRSPFPSPLPMSLPH